MAQALSLDLRERIIAAVEGGLSRRAAALRFAVSESCAIKLVRRWRQTGSVSPAQIGGYKPFALAGREELVRSLVAARSDQTLDELREQLAAAGVVVSRTAVHRYLEALGLTLKKRRSMPPSKIAPTLPGRAKRGARNSRR
jgi:putative transposase